MKRYIINSAFLFFSIFVFAQDVTLTKGETVEYLKKKYKEMEGFNTPGTYMQRTFKNFELKYIDGIIQLSYKEYDRNSGEWSTDYEYRFNPLYISRFTFATVNDYTVLHIYFSNTNFSIHQKNGNGSFVDDYEYISFLYLGTKDDQKNGEKIKKALLHLQALLKAEDDPFGN